MKIAYINYFYDDNISEIDYLDRYQTIHSWCKSVSDKGIDISVYQRFNKTLHFNKDNINYILIHDGLKNNLKFFQNPKTFHGKIIQDNPDILHINGFNYIKSAYLIKKYLPSAKIIIQHHAERQWKGIKSIFQKYYSKSTDGYIFTSNRTYDSWLNSNSLIRKKYIQIPEASTYFVSSDKSTARGNTGLSGDPIFLWVGRLNKNKDPLTVISGFNLLLKDYPEAKLYMAYSENDLLFDVLSSINTPGRLNNSVTLLGKIEHPIIADYYNSADYFVLGSHYESSGYSLIESLACGVVPIVTNIPSFNTITNNGKIGGLWECGNPESFYSVSKKVLEISQADESKKAIKFFETNLSYNVISQKSKAFYKSLMNAD